MTGPNNDISKVVIINNYESITQAAEAEARLVPLYPPEF